MAGFVGIHDTQPDDHSCTKGVDLPHNGDLCTSLDIIFLVDAPYISCLGNACGDPLERFVEVSSNDSKTVTAVVFANYPIAMLLVLFQTRLGIPGAFPRI